MCKFIFVLTLCSVVFFGTSQCSSEDRVLLQDVKAITLYRGRLTAGRRSRGVPQLNCVGGSAGCNAFVPDVIQCRNVGSDGFDVQWKCEADMEDSYKFGKLQVTCEGYDYPNDPYILRGSCGLEYTVDYTEAGKRRKNTWGGSYHEDIGYSQRSNQSWFFFIIIIAVVAFLIYKMSSSNDAGAYTPRPSRTERHAHFDDSTGYGSTGSPPPYGFKPEYTRTRSPTPPPTYDDVRYGSTNTRTETANNGSGFWTGMGLGGLAGYLFGSRNRNSYHSPGYGYGYGSGYGYGGGSGFSSHRPNYGSGWGSSWGGSSTRFRDDSSRSRNASGFASTSRR